MTKSKRKTHTPTESEDKLASAKAQGQDPILLAYARCFYFGEG